LARRLRRSSILDFKVQLRTGRPCDEREGVAGAARPLCSLISRKILFFECLTYPV
jgi:hypothetical protein